MTRDPASAARPTSWLRRAEAGDAAAVAEVYLSSFRATYDFPLVHTDDQVRAWVRDVLVGARETWVVVEARLDEVGGDGAGGTVVGFMTLDGGELDQLYVVPGRDGLGFGGRLLALAKVRRPDGLGLYTFQVNARAREFYERRGFTVVDLDDGARNEERQPDVRYSWTPDRPPGGVSAPTIERVRSADGTPIAAFRTGDGPPLVVVHGATSDHATFRVAGPLLARSHAVQALDRRGRGASGDGPGYAIEREYEDVAAVVDAVATEAGRPVDVVGHSFGGAVALGAASLTPNVRRLVLYESAPAVPGLAEPSDEVVARLRELEAAGDRTGLLRTFLRDVVGMSPVKLDEFEAATVYPDRLAAAPTVLRELTSGGRSDPEKTRELARRVHVPVLQLLGGASPLFFAAATAALDRDLPDGRVVVLDGQRHAAHHDAAEVFVAEVEAFLGL